MNRQALSISFGLQGIAQSIDRDLKTLAGERVTFVLVVNAGDVSQYVSNGDRLDGITLIEGLLDRWKAGLADIPAHDNPELRGEESR